MDAGSLVGVWDLQSWIQRYDDGRVQRPFGERPVGQLVYTAGGQMSGVIAAPDRPSLTQGQWTSPPEEAAAAYATFLAYAGLFTIEGDTVIHHVRISSFPNWVGASQRRRASLDHGLLTLSGRVEAETVNARTVELAWRRVEPQTPVPVQEADDTTATDDPSSRKETQTC